MGTLPGLKLMQKNVQNKPVSLFWLELKMSQLKALRTKHYSKISDPNILHYDNGVKYSNCGIFVGEG